MKTKSLMVLGTSSGVGKSFVTAGFCRLFSDLGYRVAPFKAQNMSNNSFVTEEGGEMGRAQAVQAECARVRPHVDMNPILLKPAEDNRSQVIVHGKSIGHFSARSYYGEKKILIETIRESYERLAAAFDLIVIEGAGSPVEMNLKENDLVNMSMAEMADAACVLVADIDRGGVFASVIGTLDLMSAEERDRVVGIIINKFRGDISLFDDGIDFLEKRTGKKVLGVLPYDRQLWLEEEDCIPCHSRESGNLRHKDGGSVRDFWRTFESKNGSPIKAFGDDSALDIAVILLPRMSNFTDFEILKHDPGVRLRYIRSAKEIGRPDLLILPGTKATIADLEYLKQNNFPEKILSFAESGGRILGICGGYQMMGEWIRDGQTVESSTRQIEGLGLFKMTTDFLPEKILRQVSSVIDISLFGQRICSEVQAYEIHMGRTKHSELYPSFGTEGAIHASGKLAGTYFHGLWDADGFRAAFLDALAADAGKIRSNSPVSKLSEIKESHYSRLARLLSENLDMNTILKIMSFPHALSGNLRHKDGGSVRDFWRTFEPKWIPRSSRGMTK